MRYLDDQAKNEIRADLLTRIEKLIAICAVSSRPCKLCGEKIHFLRTGAGNLTPFDQDGQPHFATCEAWKRNQAAPLEQRLQLLKQEQLFDAAPLPE